MKKLVLVFLGVLASLLINSPLTNACTLWAANGTLVSSSGSLLIKNRDWIPNQFQTVQLITPAAGHRYIGLFADGKYAGLKAGVNEQGLAIVTATAGSIPAAERRATLHTPKLVSTLLKTCNTVDDVLKKTELFLNPEILMVADKNTIATIEIGPNGKISVTSKKNATLFHTNHYIDESMIGFNQKIGISSQTRFTRIQQLLQVTEKAYDLDLFIKISNNQDDGPDNSIFRTGSNARKSRTMAVWAIEIPPATSPYLYVRLLNPNEAEQILQFPTDDVFSGKLQL